MNRLFVNRSPVKKIKINPITENIVLKEVIDNSYKKFGELVTFIGKFPSEKRN